MLLKNLDLEGGHNNSRQLVNGSRGQEGRCGGDQSARPDLPEPVGFESTSCALRSHICVVNP